MQPDYRLCDTAAQIAQPSRRGVFHSDEYNYATIVTLRHQPEHMQTNINGKFWTKFWMISKLVLNLNSRSRLVKIREYNLLLKMVELKKENEILMTSNATHEKIFPTGRSRYRHREQFYPVESLPSDNRSLQKIF
jgi:hypothetical protein